MNFVSLRCFWISILLLDVFCAANLVVQTLSGPVQGTKIPSISGKYVYQFRGIPYAEPPIGDMRFEKPQPASTWDDVLDATEFRASCPQSLSIAKVYIDVLSNKNMSEDCLFINVYVPGSISKSAEKSVMVWIHGGGYTIGQGMLYDGSALALKGDVIVVNFNYRLGILGFLSTGDSALPGNLGLWDQRLALEWVQKNIASFGGDPNSVTIFGESSGGFSVGLNALMPQNKGLFKRAIAESGSGTSFISLRDNPAFTANAYGKLLNCSTKISKDLVKCLKTKNIDEIVQAQTTPGVPHFEKSQFGGGPLGPVLDGDLFKEVPLRALHNTSSDVYSFFRSLDVIVGNVNAEGSLLLFGLYALENFLHFNITEGVPSSVLCNLFAPDLAYEYYNNDKRIAQDICQKYSNNDNKVQGQLIVDMYGDGFFVVPTVRGLDIHSARNTKTRSYQFMFSKPVPSFHGIPFPSWFHGAAHESELFYLFGPDFLPSIYNISEQAEEQHISDTMMKYWTNFAKTGDPNSNDVPYWPGYTPEDRGFINLDTQISKDKHLFDDRVSFWLGLDQPFHI